jgi:hypothetical protein
MPHAVDDSAFNKSLDGFIAVTVKVVPGGEDLDSYVPTVFMKFADRGHITTLVNSGKEPLDHDGLLRLLAEFGVQQAQKHGQWPHFVFVAGSNGEGISIWGSTDDQRTAAASIGYDDVEGYPEITRHYFDPQDPEAPIPPDRNPAWAFFKNKPN